MWWVWMAGVGCTDGTTPPADGTETATPTGDSAVDETATDTGPSEKTTKSSERCGPDALTGVNEGFCAPDFTLPDRDGNDLTLYDSRGDVIIVDLVALWCTSCFRLAPALERMYDAYHQDGLQIFTLVAQDVSGATPTTDHAGQWVDQFEVSHPVVADVTGKAQWEWTRNPDQVVIPMTYIIDQEGVISWFGAGDHHAPRMEEEVAGLLDVKNQGVAVPKE